jgi:hypothetical protein
VGTSFQTYTTNTFTVTAGSHTIEFLGTNANSGNNNGDNTAFIDSVSNSAGGTNWQATINVPIDGLNPGQYVLYAVINDGFNPPLASPDSVPYTPDFAVQGQITNQSNDPEGGWSVFLDYNNNGVQDPGEPSTTTNNAGYYSFDRTFGDPDLAPLSLSGFSQDVVFETGTANPTVSHDFDGSGFAWFQAGATDTNQVAHVDGLPTYFTSQSGSTFQFQSFAANNVLLLGPNGGLPSSGTLTLTTPATYTTLAILASASTPASPTGTVTVLYTDGTTGTFTYNAPDWGSGAASAALPTRVARAHAGSGATFQRTDQSTGDQWDMFEADIHPDPTKQVASLEFAANGPNTTGIFAVSGGISNVNVQSNAPFKVVVTPLAPNNFDPVAAPAVTFDGTNTVNQPFAVKEHSAIKGTVFVDQKNDGQAAHGQGVAGALVYIDANANGMLDDGEPTAIADASGHYSFANLPAGTYTVGLEVTSLSHTTPSTAFAVPAGTVGNQGNAFTYGESFAVNKPIELTSLGAFDSGGDGFTQTITVVLYDQATQKILAQMTFTPDDPGTLVGGSRFKALAQPLTLLPGFKGVIAAYGFGGADPAGDAGLSAPAWTTDDDVGRLTFNNGISASTAGAFPTTKNPSAFADPYAAGTFQFRDPAWKQTADTPLTYNVTIDSSGYDLQEHKDFGALPPSFITGTVTGYPQQNGQVAPDTQPLSGWTVNLLGDVPAAQIDAGGNGAAGFGPDSEFDVSGGTPVTTGSNIDTSQVFNPAPMEVYQTGREATDGSFNYQVTGLSPGVAYAVRLHFAEIVAVAPGQRKFNVTINGQQVLTDFDIYATAGAANTAIVRTFDTVADPNGLITITFTNGSAGAALVNGIEILVPNQVVATTTSDADGHYLFNQPTPGQYTVRQAPPADWRQVAPFFSNPGFSTSQLPAQATGTVLVPGDFNGDGYADLAMITFANDTAITLFYNQKNGSFGPADASTQQSPEPMVAAVPCDLNGDGLLDVAVLLYQSNEVDAFVNTGSSAPGQRFVFVRNYWDVPDRVGNDFNLKGLAATDLNHDGLDDLVVSASNIGQTAATVLVLLNSRLQPRPVYRYDLQIGNAPDSQIQAGPVAVGDFNGDGNPDVIVNGGAYGNQVNAINVALGDGRGGLAPWMSYQLTTTPVLTFNGGPLTLGDVKGDGSLSVAFLSSDRTNAFASADLALNRGKGVFDISHALDTVTTPLNPTPTDVRLVDVNGDLKPDLVFLLKPLDVANPGPSYVLVYLNTGTAPYFQVNDPLLFQIPISSVPATDFAFMDVNNDGRNDIIVGTEDFSGAGGYLLLNTSPLKQPGIPVFLNAGAITGDNDFLNVQTPEANAVYGQIFEDENRNTSQDASETGTAGSFVYVDLNGNGKYDAGEPTAVTRANGVYSIPNLPDGTYTVGVLPGAGEKATTPEFMDVHVDSHTAAEADFGLATRLIGDIPAQQANVDQPVSLTVPVTANTAGHRLVYTLDSTAPDGAAIDLTTGVFTWTPTVQYAGQNEVATVRVRDLNDPTFTETQSFTIQVAGSAAEVNYVSNLYTTLLGRGAADSDLVYWTGLLHNGATRQLVVQTICESAEHRGVEVDQLYVTYLHRAADAAGRSFWTGALLSGTTAAQLAAGFMGSTEYQRAHAGADGFLTGVYADVLGRVPDAAGLDFWRALLQGGMAPAQIAEDFLGSLEAERRLVDGYYQTFLDRNADTAGAQMWLSLLQSHQLSPAQVAQAFLASDEFFARVGAG